jgi:hypothetical protein
MDITIGRIVLYELTEQDAAQINRRRTNAGQIAARIKRNSEESTHWPIGAQAHIGNEAAGGQLFPMLVTRVSESRLAAGQVFLDGNDCLWVPLAPEGRGPGNWSWPPRA